jgi:phenylpropionate dioxygenase-like ring-hydroxylating dioxygenase large terminal subunit
MTTHAGRAGTGDRSRRVLTVPGLRLLRAAVRRLSGTRRSMAAARWQPLARSDEVGRHLLVCRASLAGQTRTLLVWRTRDDQPIAMDARCPHRQLPMVRGRLVDDAVECPFHGRRYSATGQCVNVRGTRSATVLEVREAAGVLWLET